MPIDKSLLYQPPAGDGVGLSINEPQASFASTALTHHFVTPGLYTPPAGSSVDFQFKEDGYVPPLGAVANFKFRAQDESGGGTGETQYVSVQGWVLDGYGAPTARRAREVITPAGIDSNVIGLPSVRNDRRYVAVSGFATYASGTPNAELSRRFLGVIGFAAGGFGTTVARNFNATAADAGAIASAAYGTPTVQLRTRYVSLSGLAAGAMSSGASITNGKQYVLAGSLAPAGAGTPVVQALRRYLDMSGIAPSGTGTPTAYIVVPRYVTPGSIVQAAYGSPGVESTIRYVTVGGIAAGAPGAHTAWFRVRTVAPTGPIGVVAQPSVKDGKQYVLLAGLAAFAGGTPSAFRNEAFVKPSGFAGDTGAPAVQLARRSVLVASLTSSEAYGTGRVFNSQQFVQPTWPFDAIGAAGTPAEVLNANRTVAVFGITEPRITGGAEVANTARVITPPGLASLEQGGTMVADRVRAVRVDGFSETFLPTYASVLNGRIFVEPTGLAPGKAGVPTIPDRRQPLDAVGNIRPLGFGDALVAPRLRSIDLAFRGISTLLSNPTVFLYTRYVAPKGWTLGAGVPSVVEHFNVITAGGYDLAAYGTAEIHNVTPELAVAGMALTLYGKPAVINYNSYVRPTGAAVGAIGAATLGPRVRMVYPGGFDALRVSTQTGVSDDSPKPPARQFVDLTTAGTTDPAKYGANIVSLMGAIVTGFTSEGYGKPTLRTNVISGVTVPATYAVGDVKTNRQQLVAVPSIELKKADSKQPNVFGSEWFGTPFFSPTVVAASPVSPGTFGTISLTNKNREVAPYGIDSFDYGFTVLMNLRQRVTVTGLGPGRFGIPSVPGLQLVKPYWGPYSVLGTPPAGYEAATFGRDTTVKPAPATNPGTPGDPHPTQKVTPAGLVGAIGAAVVQLKNRTVFAATINPGLIPVVSVHPPITVKPAGLASMAIGALATGHKIRKVLVSSEGFETHWGHEFGDGFKPMVVRLKHAPIKVPSFTSRGAAGTPLVALASRRVDVPGLAGETGVATVSSRASVQPEGFDSLVLGLPKRPVYGQIEPVGEEQAAYGLASIGRGIHPAYIEPGLAGAPRVRSVIGVPGLAGDFGDTIVVGESNCGSKLAVVAQLGDLTKFGQHGVHQ